MKDTTLIFLAGGNGTRMGTYGKCFSKSLCLVYDEPLILRQLRQAIEIGVKNIIISTIDRFYKQCLNVIKISGMEKSVNELIVRNNPDHQLGPLPALMRCIKNVKTKKILLAFPDLYYFENPYETINKHKYTNHKIFSLTAKPFDPRELSFGGVAFNGAHNSISIVEHPLTSNKNGTRWAGLTLFDSRLMAMLKLFFRSKPIDSPVGDFFEYCRIRGVPIFSMKGPDFINVNTLDDLFLVSLYRSAESGALPAQLEKRAYSFIPYFRKYLVYKKAANTYELRNSVIP